MAAPTLPASPCLFCLSLQTLSSWRLWTLWQFVRCQKSPQGSAGGGGGRKSPSKGLDSFSLNPQLGSDSNLFRSWTKGSLFPSFFFCLIQACVCGINWSIRCWWRRSLETTACLFALASCQALHCTILVQHDMHTWLLPSIAIKHCLFHERSQTAEEQPTTQGHSNKQVWSTYVYILFLTAEIWGGLQ